MLSRPRTFFLMIIPLMILASCAAIGALPTIVDAIKTVSSVAGRPARPDQTAAVVRSGSPTIGDTVVMRGTQGLIVAHNAYQSATAIAEVYVRSGRATPAQLVRIRELNDRGLWLLEKGGAGLTVAQRAAEVLNIVAELNLFGGRN